MGRSTCDHVADRKRILKDNNKFFDVSLSKCILAMLTTSVP